MPDDRIIVTTRVTGDRAADVAAADAAARRRVGDPGWRRPPGTVWHDPGDGRSLQLVPLEIHAANPHGSARAEGEADAGAPEVGAADPGTEAAGAGAAGAPAVGWRPASPEPLAGSHPPPPEQLLDRVEAVLEVRLPADYRRFLGRGNGGVPQASRFVDGTTGRLEVIAAFLPLAPRLAGSIFAFLELYGDRLPPGTLPVAHDPFGNVLLLGVDEPWDGRVLFWDHEREPEPDAEGNVTWTNVHAVAADFAELLRRFVAD